MKKFFLFFALCLCSLASWAQQFDYYHTCKLTCKIKPDNTVEITEITDIRDMVVNIPSTVPYNNQYYTVTSIGWAACHNHSDVALVVIPRTVTSIGQAAFGYCTNLRIVDFSNSATSIGDFAFSNCQNLWEVSSAESVTYIGNQAFYLCKSLPNITIGNSVTYIGNEAFQGCESLTSVVIGNSVTSIGNLAFNYCTSLTNVTIGNSVTTIEYGAFSQCLLSSVIIPNSVTTIGSYAFQTCPFLTSVTIGNSVSTIGAGAFDDCGNLKTIYNLSSVQIEANSYGLAANRVVVPTTTGTGANTLYQIPDTYSFEDTEDNVANHIPRSTIPNIDNLIYNDGGWKAKNIVLTDDTSRFVAPVGFTAETATYTREFTNSNRSTLYLPFTASMPQDLEVYEFSGFNGSSLSFSEHTGDIAAYTPYLVGYDLSKDGNTTTCTITQANAVFPKSETANYNPVTHNDMTFQGVISRTQMSSTNHYGYSNGFFVQSGGSAHVNPFRCYFLYTPSSNAPQNLPPTLNVEFDYGDPVGIEAVEMPEQEYDGRYGKDVYDMMGRLVRKNADNLQGLPRGIYIWKGKKVMNYEL